MSIKKSQAILAMNSDNELIKFLDNFRVKKSVDLNVKITHTSMPGTGVRAGSYYIPEEKEKLLYDLLKKHIFVNKIPCHLIERHTEVGPIVIDIDLRYDITVKKRKHTEKHILAFLEVLYKEINKYFVFQNSSDELIAFIFERKGPYKDRSNVKDGIHIMFPFIVSEPNIQMLIRANIIKSGVLDEIFGDLDLKNSMADVYDRSVIDKNGWFMYGCTKPNCETYDLTHVYDNELDEMDSDVFDKERFIELFSIRNKKDETIINEDYKDEIEQFSLRRSKTKTIKKKIIRKVYDFDRIVQLVNLLKDERADSEPTWIEVGWCLHNIDPNNEDMLKLWIEFSKKSAKFKEGECEKRWNKFHVGDLTEGSLRYWVKKDNPDGYDKLIRDDIQGEIEKGATNYDIAQILHKMFGEKFRCGSIKYSSWYQFKNHRWHQVDSGSALRRKISEDLVKEYLRLISRYNELATEENIDDDEHDGYLKKIEKLLETTIKLKSTSFKDNVMKECKEVFYDKEFLAKLDSNKYLLGFENGVYDLKLCEFRDGEPEDYVSKTTGNNYIEYDPEDDYVEEIKDYMKQVFPDHSVREYMWYYLCSCLQGHNAEEKFHIWTGCGANSKSKLLELFISSIGEYAHKFPITLLTSKRAASNSASPELVMAKGARFCYCEEPDEDTRINVGLMKEMTGNDVIFARGLYSDPIQFRPQFKLNLLCNQLPKVPPYDKGTWRRLRKVDFVSEFVEYEPKLPNQFPCDPYLSDKLAAWKETFMSILLDYYSQYRSKLNGKLVAPKAILEATAEYQRESDAYIQFLEDNYEITNEPTDEVDVDEMYDEFKLWHIELYNAQKVPCKKEIKKYLARVYNPKWINHRNKIKNIKKIVKKLSAEEYDSDDETAPSIASKKAYEEIKEKQNEFNAEFSSSVIS